MTVWEAPRIGKALDIAAACCHSLPSSRNSLRVPTIRRVTSRDSSSQISAAQYDAMAAYYAASNAEHAYNTYYERPAAIAMLGDVADRRVLDAGCGSGPLAAWLAEHRARVTAFDESAEMTALARRRLGEDADIRVADLAWPLTFAPDQAFDLVVASLVLH
jgi:ubiquinone/menaquinone biosynthesis C-methylase UbiE